MEAYDNFDKCGICLIMFCQAEVTGAFKQQTRATIHKGQV
jgi:hypothetical protein